MKKCKSCQTEIDSKAKKCAHCRADQRNWFGRHKVLTGIAVLVVLFIFISASGDNKKSETNISVATEAANSDYKVGETIPTDKFEFIVTSVEERSTVGSQYFEKSPSEGGTFVAVQYQYKNITAEPIGTFSTPRIQLEDKNGTLYTSDAGASGNFATELKLDRKILSDLNPGINVKDAVIFEISKDQYANPGWSLIITADKELKVTVK